MKRGILALAALAAVLVLPTAASGGQTGDNYRISLTLKTFNGEVTEVKHFRFSKLNATCAGGVTREVRGRIRSMAVNDNDRFSETVRRNGKQIRVKGQVGNDNETVSGLIRAKGDFRNGESCRTGRVNWTTD
jgi:hypothetical protein